MKRGTAVLCRDKMRMLNFYPPDLNTRKPRENSRDVQFRAVFRLVARAPKDHVPTGFALHGCQIGEDFPWSDLRVCECDRHVFAT